MPADSPCPCPQRSLGGTGETGLSASEQLVAWWPGFQARLLPVCSQHAIHRACSCPPTHLGVSLPSWVGGTKEQSGRGCGCAGAPSSQAIFVLGGRGAAGLGLMGGKDFWLQWAHLWFALSCRPLPFVKVSFGQRGQN